MGGFFRLYFYFLFLPCFILLCFQSSLMEGEMLQKNQSCNKNEHVNNSQIYPALAWNQVPQMGKFQFYLHNTKQYFYFKRNPLYFYKSNCFEWDYRNYLGLEWDSWGGNQESPELISVISGWDISRHKEKSANFLFVFTFHLLFSAFTIHTFVANKKEINK